MKHCALKLSSRNFFLSFSFLCASLAIPASLAAAQQCDYIPASLMFDSFDGGPCRQQFLTLAADKPADYSRVEHSIEILRPAKRPDLNQDVFFRNKMELSLEGGWLPFNIPFPFDIFTGDAYNLYPLRYTLVPMIASVRWHTGDAKGPLILRGNWDVTFSLAAVAIPRGAETRYFAYMMGLRRNFVPRNWRVTPYFDERAGLGLIDAKGPLGVYYAQGQNFTFTLNLGAGLRYNLNSRYAFSAGLNWMHISNANLSAPSVSNYGINVYGPVFGLDILLRRHSRQSQ
ncbi:MAG TPA: acyloxyacyl hydrolase [Candidatus Sulfotelmatobacter sp.]|nr:acyloxyacyl hydrolase [Candidatus Sulfotelmatobacter sp.]